MTHDDAHAEFHAKSAAMMEGGGLSGDPAWEVQRVINHWSAVPPEVLVEREAELADLRACRDRIVAIEAARAAGLHQHGGTDAPECRTCTPAPERDTEPSGGLTEAEVEDLYRRWLQKVSFTHLTSAVERIIAARTQAPTDDTETCTYCGQDFPKPVEIHHAERDCQFTNAGGFLVWAGETGGECCWVGYECPYHFRLKNGLSTEGLSPRPPTDVAEGGLVERLRALTAEYDAMGNTHAPGRDVADDLRALLVPVRPPIDVAGLCHWTQNRDNVQHHQTHEEFHFGNTCPYAAVAAILRGELDPRDPADAAPVRGSERVTGVELLCDDCQQPYGCWYADNDVWNYVMGGPEAKGDPGGMLCPRCFTTRAEVVFEERAIWHLTLDRTGTSGELLRGNCDSERAETAGEES